MGTEKRERQKANRLARLEEARLVQADNQRTARAKRFTILGVLGLIAIALVIFFATRGGDDNGGVAAGSDDGIAAENNLTADGAATDDAGTDDGRTIQPPPPVPAGSNVGEAATERCTGGGTSMAPVDPSVEPTGDVPADFVPYSGTRALAGSTPESRANIYDSPNNVTIDTARTYEAEIVTAKGTMRLCLFDDESPLTVNNFINLANDGFYDGVPFHRVMADFMTQGGDPTGTGGGGPGYTFQDEVTNGLEFDRRGQLAMANSGPSTNGSQFFITFASTEWLTGNHTIFGQLLEGDDVLGAINITEDGLPPDTIFSIEIFEI